MDKVMRVKWYFNINQKGISLAEILITLAIVGALAMIGIPHYQRSKRKAMQTEAKTLLVKLYASERAFIGEWGYGTPNFHQLGFSPQGTYFYNAGWSANSADNIKSGSIDINEVYDSTKHNPSDPLFTTDPIPGYEGPYLPSDLTKTSYNTGTDLKKFTSVKEFCQETHFDKTKVVPPCIFNLSAKTDPNFNIIAKLGTHDINIDNGTSKTTPPTDVTFRIGAKAHFDGATLSDEWVIDENGNLKNVQIGL